MMRHWEILDVVDITNRRRTTEEDTMREGTRIHVPLVSRRDGHGSGLDATSPEAIRVSTIE
jgi:hypothetical protein